MENGNGILKHGNVIGNSSNLPMENGMKFPKTWKMEPYNNV